MQYLARGSTWDSTREMLPVLYTHFVMTKQELNNEHMEQSNLRLKRP